MNDGASGSQRLRMIVESETGQLGNAELFPQEAASA